MNMKKIAQNIASYLIITTCILILTKTAFMAGGISIGNWSPQGTGFSTCGPCNTELLTIASGIKAYEGFTPQQIAAKLGEAGIQVNPGGASPTGRYPYNGTGKTDAQLNEILKQHANKTSQTPQQPSQTSPEKPQTPATSPKANTDKCVLVTPGMSNILGNMYGDVFVRAYNDKHKYLSELMGCLSVRPETPIPTFESSLQEEIPFEPCVYAVDYGGDPATKTESKQNFDIRKLQTKENVDKYSVTTDDDWKSFVKTHADQLLHKGTTKQGKSNQTINTENINLKLGEGYEWIPTAEQHLEYWFKNWSYPAINPTPTSSKDRGYTVGSDSIKMFTGSPFTAGDKAESLKNKGTGVEDVFVTEDCDYIKNTEKTPRELAREQAQNGNFNWQDVPGGSGGVGNGGNGGLGNSGGLSSLLPALMQALQGLSGQGQNKNDDSSSDSSSTSDYECPESTSDEIVCGADGNTYRSSCVAQYENQVSVKHTGECTSADTATSTDALSALDQILEQITSSGIPSSLMNSVMSVVANLITEIFTSGESLTTTEVQ